MTAVAHSPRRHHEATMADFTDEDVQRGARAATGYLDAVTASEWDERDLASSVLAAVLPEYAKRVRAEALREAADDLALWLYEVNMPDDVITATCAWLRLRARADALTEPDVPWSEPTLDPARYISADQPDLPPGVEIRQRGALTEETP
jgi:hypothetical protein